MKKFLSILAVSALSMLFMQGCGENTKPTPDPTPTPGQKEDLKLSVSATSDVPVGSYAFTVSAETATSKTLVLNVTSSDPNIIKVAETITLTKGEKSVTGTFTAQKTGTATLTISTEEATIAKNSATITIVGELAETLTLSPDNPDSPTASAQNVWVPMSGQGGFYFHKLGWDGNGNSLNKLSYDLYGGDVVGEQRAEGIVFKAVAKDTPIDDKLAWLQTGWKDDGKDKGTKYTCMPYIAIEGEYTAGTGNVYLVCTLPLEGKGTDVFVRAWVLVDVDPTAMTVTFIDGAMCTNDAEFKVGQH